MKTGTLEQVNEQCWAAEEEVRKQNGAPTTARRRTAHTSSPDVIVQRVCHGCGVECGACSSVKCRLHTRRAGVQRIHATNNVHNCAVEPLSMLRVPEGVVVTPATRACARGDMRLRQWWWWEDRGDMRTQKQPSGGTADDGRVSTYSGSLSEVLDSVTTARVPSYINVQLQQRNRVSCGHT